MKDDEPSDPPLEIARWRAQERLFDVLCRSYEAALQGGRAAGLKPFVASHAGNIERELFRHLLEVELEFLAAQGEPPQLAAYLERYPDLAPQVGKAFATVAQWGVIELAEGLDEAVAEAERRNADERIGDYRVLRKLGEGAFAEVFLAEDLAGRIVAVKATERESREPHLLQKLNHPHIVKLHHYTRLPGTPVRHLLCMEYVPSISLKALTSLMRRDAPRSGARVLEALTAQWAPAADQAAGLATQGDDASPIGKMTWPMFVAWLGARLAGAVAYAHDQGVLHRDLKPANILIDERGSPTLVDFNVSFEAHDRHDDASPQDVFGGSLPYMAPEHLAAYAADHDADRVDRPADVYSLGVVLYELLVGRRPMRDETLAGRTVARVAGALRREMESLTLEFSPDCPVELRWILEQCLQVAPESRPDAAEVRRRLHYIGSLELQKRVVPEYRPWELAHPRWAAAAYLSALMTVCFLPTAPVLIMGAFFYNALIVGSAPQLMSAWDSDFAWRCGSLWGSLGVALVFAIAVAHLWPALRAIATRERRPLSRRQSLVVANRCLSVGPLVAFSTVISWTLVGLAVPLSLLHFGRGRITAPVVLDSVWQSTLHGLIGFAPTFLIVSYLAVDYLVLRLVPRADMASSYSWIPLLRRMTVVSRLVLPAAAAALAMQALTVAPGALNAALYVKCLMVTLVLYAALVEYWAHRLTAVLDVAEAALEA